MNIYTPKCVPVFKETKLVLCMVTRAVRAGNFFEYKLIVKF